MLARVASVVAATAASGGVVIVSIWSHPASVNVHSVVMKELDVRGKGPSVLLNGEVVVSHSVLHHVPMHTALIVK